MIASSNSKGLMPNTNPGSHLELHIDPTMATTGTPAQDMVENVEWQVSTFGECHITIDKVTPTSVGTYVAMQMQWPLTSHEESGQEYHQASPTLDFTCHWAPSVWWLNTDTKIKYLPNIQADQSVVWSNWKSVMLFDSTTLAFLLNWQKCGNCMVIGKYIPPPPQQKEEMPSSYPIWRTEANFTQK